MAGHHQWAPTVQAVWALRSSPFSPGPICGPLRLKSLVRAGSWSAPSARVGRPSCWEPDPPSQHLSSTTPQPALWGGPSASWTSPSPRLLSVPPLHDPLKNHQMHLSFAKKQSNSLGHPSPHHRKQECKIGQEAGVGGTELPRGGAVMGQPGPPLSSLPSPLLWASLCGAWSQPANRRWAALQGGLRPHPSPDLPQAQVASDLTAPSPACLPTVHGIKWTCSNGNSSSGFSVEQLVQQILDSHQTKPPPRTHNCLCTGSLGEPGRRRACGQGVLPGSRCDVWEGRGVSHEQATARRATLLHPSWLGW